MWQQQPAPLVVSLERRVLLQRLQPAEREAAPPRLRPAAQLGHVLARAVSQRDATCRRRVVAASALTPQDTERAACLRAQPLPVSYGVCAYVSDGTPKSQRKFRCDA